MTFNLNRNNDTMISRIEKGRNNLMNRNELAQIIDHTNLKNDISEQEMKRFCEEAISLNVKMVAINSSQTKYCKELLRNSLVKVGAAISFPFGQTTIETKVFETLDAIKNGADEIDYVINLSKLKSGDYTYIEEEMKAIVTVCREHTVTSKVIFENCLLSDYEKIKLCEIANEVKPDYVKTSTGFSHSGATVEDVQLMRKSCHPDIQIKAAGQVRSYETAIAMIEAGATRIGTSATVKILAGAKL